MSAAHIRYMLRVARHARRELEALPQAEFIARENVGTYLAGVIERLKALYIPTRYKPEVAQRDAEIGMCEDTIQRWLKARSQSVRVTATLVSPDGKRLELGEGIVEFVNIGEAIAEARREPEERIYGRGGVVLRVIDGGKK